MSYASERGFRPATRAEKIARGFKPSTRAYTNDATGEVASHRSIQSHGLVERYGGDTRGALEARAAVRSQEMGIRSPRKTFDKMVDKFARTKVDEGGLGARYDKRTRTYIMPDKSRASFQEIARSGDFRDKESGMWQQWQRIRHGKGPKGELNRYNFLKRYGFMRDTGGKWWEYRT